jgi:tetratricopeptide (TPR) repeat protein
MAQKELADLLLEAGEYQASVLHYEAALRVQPDFVEAKQNLDLARSLLGR